MGNLTRLGGTTGTESIMENIHYAVSCGGAIQSDKPHWWGWGTQLIILVSPKENKECYGESVRPCRVITSC